MARRHQRPPPWANCRKAESSLRATRTSPARPMLQSTCRPTVRANSRGAALPTRRTASMTSLGRSRECRSLTGTSTSLMWNRLGAGPTSAGWTASSPEAELAEPFPACAVGALEREVRTLGRWARSGQLKRPRSLSCLLSAGARRRRRLQHAFVRQHVHKGTDIALCPVRADTKRAPEGLDQLRDRRSLGQKRPQPRTGLVYPEVLRSGSVEHSDFVTHLTPYHGAILQFHDLLIGLAQEVLPIAARASQSGGREGKAFSGIS
jgi:hypothetical protein